MKDGMQKEIKLNELSDLLSFKVPQFMKGLSYWQLFKDIYEHNGVLLLGVFT